MYKDGKIYMGLASDGSRVHMQLNMSNRHGLIAGATGSGKTTVVNLLMRFYPVDKGEILVDGVRLNDLTSRQIAQKIRHRDLS